MLHLLGLFAYLFCRIIFYIYYCSIQFYKSQEINQKNYFYFKGDSMLYERLTKLIEETGKSMNQIETELNYPRNTLQSYKRSNPSAKRLAEIAKYFNVSTDYLLGREENKTENDLTEEESELLAAFRMESEDMTKEEQAKFNQSVKNMMKIARELFDDESNWKK